MKRLSLRTLRIIALFEGTSFVLLLLIAMPLKYLADMPMPVTYVGWAHGYLFMAYLIVLILALVVGAVGIKRAGIGFVAGIVPFGTFLHDKPLKRREAELG
ncbi:MAG: DUF3817 domain-containing protein [Pseudomonadota bacterium]|nr:DUF3817 domain-containing protein [Pseudomonadota bacterium]